MLTLLAAAAAVKLAYSFPVAVSRTYDIQSVFDGFIPLFGGREAKVEVDLAITAKGLQPASDGNPQVLSTLDDIKVLLNGDPLPIVTRDSVKDYFPPTTITTTPLGATLKTDAPDKELPVKLPGLDIKRVPDITYLPLQLPDADAEVGKSYTFTRSFGGSDIKYTVTPTKVTDDAVDLNVAMTQSYDVMENEGKEVVKDQKDAFANVHTDVKGSGTATFDRHAGAFSVVNVSADATSSVTEIATKAKSERKLKSTLLIKLRKA